MENTRELIAYGFNELAHHGIAGMRWGIRRYQNRDGSLTPAGRKKRMAEQTDAKLKRIDKRTDAKIKKMKIESRYLKKIAKAEDKAAAKLAKAEAKYTIKRKNKNLETNEKPREKSINEMTNDELKNKIERIKLEQTLASLSPQRESKGKAFMRIMRQDVIKPAAINIGKSYLENTLKGMLGLDKDTLKDLERDYKKADYEFKIAEAKQKTKDLGKEKEKTESYEDMTKFDKVVDKYETYSKYKKKKDDFFNN